MADAGGALARNVFLDFVDRTVGEIGARNCCVHVVSRDGRRILCQAVSSGYRATHLAHGLDLSACAHVRNALATGRPIAVTDARHDPGVAAVARKRYGLEACLYVPVMVEGAAQAIAIYSYGSPHEWSEAQVAAAVGAAAELGRELARTPVPTPLDASESTSWQHATLDAVPVQLALVDRELNVVWANAALAGGGADEGRGEPRLAPRALFDHPERGEDFRNAAEAILAGELARYAGLVVTAEGSFKVELRPVKGAGEDGVLSVSSVDVTEVVHARAALDATQHYERLGRLATTVSHEFGNVLQVARLGVDALAAAAEGAEAEGTAAATRRALERGAALTRQLLSFSGAKDARSEVLDLPRLLQRWWPLLRQSAGAERRVRLSVADPSFALCDEDGLQLALMNLLANARDATSPGERIELILDELGDYTTIEVRDEGRGMSADVLRQAAEPFFTTKGPDRHPGLGLSTVRELAEAHGGFLELLSEPGAGTRVVMHLRRAPGSHGAEGPERGRLLLLEDDPELAHVTRQELTRLGFDVHVCADVDALREALSAAVVPEVVLLDLALPSAAAGALLDELAGLVPRPRVVLSLGPRSGALGRLAAERGLPFVAKPYGARELARVLGASEAGK
ncbi:MAG: ATP-binding protein [Myxococcota bacterium]